MVQNIILTVDGSEQSRRAAEFGIELAKNLGARITLIHAIESYLFEDMLAMTPGSAADMAKPIYESIRSTVEEYMQNKMELCDQYGVPCDKVIRIGHPVSEVVNLADELNADLIIMGSHGRGRISGSMLGSVSYGVVHDSNRVPVLLVK